jgi:signal transduction histidine kinase
MSSHFKMPSMTIQALVLTLMLGGIVWVVLDHFQSRDIQALFFKELSFELDAQAKTNRILFNQVAESHLKAAQLIVFQKQFQEYVKRDWWQTKELIEYKGYLPNWLPSPSLMQQFFSARFAILLDSNANPREIYYHLPDPLPDALKYASSSFVNRSRSQSYITSIEETPYILASYTLMNDDEQPIASLLLGSPIDSRFLADTQTNSSIDGSVVALINPQNSKVWVSSDPKSVPTGVTIDSLSNTYLRTKTSGFFDDGGSDLAAEFVSLIPTEKAYHIANQVLEKAKQQRTVLAGVLIISFLFLTFFFARRIRHLSGQIYRFSKESLGLEKIPQQGDEVAIIIQAFEQLRDSISNTITRANAIAAGQYNQQSHRSEQDQLGRALTDMNNTLQAQAEQLREEQEKLLELNNELEQRVSKRTQDLQTALENVQNAQKQLVEAEKMAALGGLVAGVAHEINTPIGVGVTASSMLDERVKAFSTLLESGQLKKTDLNKFLEGISEISNIILPNLNRAADLIRSFKQIAVDQTSLELREFNVKAYLEEILLSLRPKLKKTKHHLEIICPSDIELYANPGHFSQIITNLIMNSLMHAFHEEESGQLTIEAKIEQNRLYVHFYDNGKGIPKENLSKIFDPFFTTARGKGGSGLGLSVIYNLITQNMGGSIRCESEEHQGTNFYFDLPLHREIEENKL